MSDRAKDEMMLRRALQLEPVERLRLDTRALAAGAEAVEQEWLVRWILGALGVALVLPALAVAQIATALVADPSLLTKPTALAALVAGPLQLGLSILAQPATAVAVVAGVAIFTVFGGREQVHVHATRT